MPTINVARFSSQCGLNAAEEIAIESATNVKSTGNPKRISLIIEGVLFLFTIKLRNMALSNTKHAGSMNMFTYFTLVIYNVTFLFTLFIKNDNF